ncbi:NAD(P)H-hydrate dehydratase [Natroniella sulfidigena]|uniref:NAD(P)H-hydrate dehydratase n=1 Tax=Natroniella sulfidigena TaxID=723921 RepID=UPI00200B99A3|nr:NAD(P)H-hydrate dehydratase [Natroniella sulfidigena]MCK8816145.1 NAD(P)H-hydrate dehydratase [Natroniella sulfidigena]
MKVVTGAEMKEIDRQAIEEIGIPGVVLMERAGMKVAAEANDLLAQVLKPEVIILAGCGNNGGDGFVVSRLLAAEGIAVKTILVGQRERISGDAKINLDILESLNLSVIEIRAEEELIGLKDDLEEADLLIDALLGTGITGQLRGLYPDLIKLINQVTTPVLAVDIPSGVEAGTAKVRSVAVEAERTVTFGLPKLGTILYPGREYVGDLKVVDIGLPEQVIAEQNLTTELITPEVVKQNLVPRKQNTHKGDYGKLLIVAGSQGMTGAAILTAQASLRIGAGLVTVGTPSSLNPILESKLVEAMTYPLAETEQATLALEAEQEIMDLMEGKDLMAVGPGLGQDEQLTTLLHNLLATVTTPLVIDADGLNAIQDLELLAKREAPTVLTPHPGELARLVDLTVEQVEEDRVGLARKLARQYQVILVLKGAQTIIATPNGQTYLNLTGNAGLATGGSGDLLTGMIAGLAVQGLELITATVLAVYLHGLAGDLAKERLTEYGLIPSELLTYLPEAIKKTRRGYDEKEESC